MTVLVTGASGFVGRALVTHLARHEQRVVRAASRRAPEPQSAPRVEMARAPDLNAASEWRAALAGCTAVVHAAARVHVMRDDATDPLAAFRSVNVAGTRRLAEQAAAAGVRRFVFVSSIKVNGERTEPGGPFTNRSPAAPCDPYGVSKWEAECALHEVSARTGMEVAIVRPVLVYGPGVGANFRRLLQALRAGVPLPLRNVDNRRSLVALANLTSLVERLLTHPGAAGHTFLVSDGDDLSTPELLRRAARAIGTTARLVPCPAGLLRAAASLAGQADVADRLLGSLQVDISDTTSRLGWVPPVTVDAALADTAHAFQASDR